MAANYYYSVEGETCKRELELELPVDLKSPHGQFTLLAAAEAAAEHYHAYCDGWERDWPLEFIIYEKNQKPIIRASVERESEPHFSADVLELE